MKLTKTFQTSASNKIRALSVWQGFAAESNLLFLQNLQAAQTEHCAHVAEYQLQRWLKHREWREAVRADLVNMGLINDE